jgi:NADPH:quinone reductase
MTGLQLNNDLSVHETREQDATDRSRSFCGIVGAGNRGIARSEEMKAIRCREWGTPDVLRLEEAESPSLKPHQVRIRVRAAGVNFADSLMVGGTYQVKPPFPFTPGLEAAGEIIETGSTVDGLQAGQRVLAVLRNGGGYAEEIVL